MWVVVRGCEGVGALGEGGGGGGMKWNEPKITVDAVDDGFKLRSHAQ